MSHTAHVMRENSLAAYRTEERKLSRRCQAILDWISARGPRTDRQIMQCMGFTDMNSVRPRITELIEQGLLMEVCSVRCPVTGKTVRKVDIRRPRQSGLFDSLRADLTPTRDGGLPRFASADPGALVQAWPGAE